jgi:hypothetical protein
MLSDFFKKWLNDNIGDLHPNALLMMNKVYDTLLESEKKEEIFQMGGPAVLDDTNKKNESETEKEIALFDLNKLADEAIGITKKCFDVACNLVNDKVSGLGYIDFASKLIQIMMDYINNKQRIEKSSDLFNLGFKAIESLSPKPGVVGETFASFVRAQNPLASKVWDEDMEYKQHVEKLINSDDFLNESLDVKNYNVGMLQKAVIDESVASLSMEVLCYNSLGNLKKVTNVKQVLYANLDVDNYKMVAQIVTSPTTGDLVTHIGLLIS